MSFVPAIQNGILLNKNGEQVSIETADYLMNEGNQLPLSNIIYNTYSVKDVYIAFHYKDLDYASYLLKASELEAQVVQAIDRIQLLKMFTSNLLDRPEWDTPVGQLPDPSFCFSTSNIEGQPILDAVQRALVQASAGNVRPIIIVPADSQSLINVGNIKQFIETGIINRTVSRSIEAPDVVNTPKQYHINQHLKIVSSDLVQTIRPVDWDRVIAVFLQGHKWEFTLFPMKHPLQQMQGFYIGTRPCQNKFPGLKEFIVDQKQHHKDPIVQKEILSLLQQFVMKVKPQFSK